MLSKVVEILGRVENRFPSFLLLLLLKIWFVRRISFESFEYTNEVLTTFLDISSTTIKTALKDGRAKMHPPSSLTSCFDYGAMSLSLSFSLFAETGVSFWSRKFSRKRRSASTPRRGRSGRRSRFCLVNKPRVRFDERGRKRANNFAIRCF